MSKSTKIYTFVIAIVVAIQIVPSTTFGYGGGGIPSLFGVVNGGASSGVVASGQVLGDSDYVFTEYLIFGECSEEVEELQKTLTDRGFYTGPITGCFYYLTQRAVKQFQATNDIEQVGVVGPITRSVLNDSAIGGIGNASSVEQIVNIRTQVELLQKQVNDIVSKLQNILQRSGN